MLALPSPRPFHHTGQEQRSVARYENQAVAVFIRGSPDNHDMISGYPDDLIGGVHIKELAVPDVQAPAADYRVDWAQLLPLPTCCNCR